MKKYHYKWKIIPIVTILLIQYSIGLKAQIPVLEKPANRDESLRAKSQ